MDRLTHERCNGIKTGYWSAAKKEELIQRLAAYENTGLEPEQIEVMKGHSVALMEELEEREFPWISVKDRLPELTDPATPVLLVTETGMQCVGYYYKGITTEWYDGFYTNCIKVNATHWMPLPKRPEEE